jgi:2-aminoethylphosphonate-pyruvate transaminase
MKEILLTPGPVTTSTSVKSEMMFDHCTWDESFKNKVEYIRMRVLEIGRAKEGYTSILLQGSGTYVIEALIQSLGEDDKLLVVANGIYGKRLSLIASKLGINNELLSVNPHEQIKPEFLDEYLSDKTFTHITFVHLETTTGVLHDLNQLMPVIRKHQLISMIDATSSFGGTEINIGELGIDYLTFSTNKCLHGIPGIGICIAKVKTLKQTRKDVKSFSLDLYSQWDLLDGDTGSFRFTAPTHTIYSTAKALEEYPSLIERISRYNERKILVESVLDSLGFEKFPEVDSNVVSVYKWNDEYDYQAFYHYFHGLGFVLFPKLMEPYHVFRVGLIGEYSTDDLNEFLEHIKTYFSKEVI